MDKACEEAFAEEWGFRKDTRPAAERYWIYGWFKRGWEAAQQNDTNAS